MPIKIPQFVDLTDLAQIEYKCFDDLSNLLCSAQYNADNFKLHDNNLNIPYAYSKQVRAVTLTVSHNDQTDKTYQWSIGGDERTITTLNIPPALIRTTNTTVYQNTEFDKQTIANILRRKSDVAKRDKHACPANGKNLVYYTCYDPTASSGYLQLLICSIQSIKQLATTPFDIMVICDQATQQHLQNSEICEYIDDYHLVVSTGDPIGSSLDKLRIFDYQHIDRYKKVLFLDCDTVAVKDIGAIFQLNIPQNKLLTVSNPAIPFDSFRTLHHGLHAYQDRDLVRLQRDRQKPFNAGQFLFVNNGCMKQHFANVLWLLSVWPGPYFFEQSFMNHYFCGFSLTDSTVLCDFINLVAVGDSNGEIDTSAVHHATILHFIGPALNASAKLQFQKQYLHASKLRQ